MGFKWVFHKTNNGNNLNYCFEGFAFMNNPVKKDNCYAMCQKKSFIIYSPGLRKYL